MELKNFGSGKNCDGEQRFYYIYKDKDIRTFGLDKEIKYLEDILKEPGDIIEIKIKRRYNFDIDNTSKFTDIEVKDIKDLGFPIAWNSVWPIFSYEDFVIKTASNGTKLEEIEHEMEILKRAKSVKGVINPLFYVKSDNTIVGYAMKKYDSLPRQMHINNISQEQTLKWIDDLVTIIKNLHSIGIYHCDIRRNNIVLDDEMNLVLIDFGSAKDCERALISDIKTSKLWKPKWEGEVDLRKYDYYSLCVTIYELLTSKYPDGNTNALEYVSDFRDNYNLDF